MGRSAEVPDPAAISLADFAVAMQELRQAAGSPSFEELGRRSDQPAAELAAAASGRIVPSFVITLAFVRGCSGDEDEWARRWHVLQERLGEDTERAAERHARTEHAGAQDAWAEDAGAQDAWAEHAGAQDAGRGAVSDAGPAARSWPAHPEPGAAAVPPVLWWGGPPTGAGAEGAGQWIEDGAGPDTWQPGGARSGGEAAEPGAGPEFAPDAWQHLAWDARPDVPPDAGWVGARERSAYPSPPPGSRTTDSGRPAERTRRLDIGGSAQPQASGTERAGPGRHSAHGGRTWPGGHSARGERTAPGERTGPRHPGPGRGSRGPRRAPPLLAGALAVFAVAVLGLGYFVFFRPGHVGQAVRSSHAASTGSAPATPSPVRTSAAATPGVAQFPAVAGVGCDPRAGSGAVTGTRNPGGDGWVRVHGGLPACGGQALATRKSGMTGLVQDTFTWAFHTGHPSTCTAQIFIARTNPSSGFARYDVYGDSLAAGASIGQFEIDQGATKGQWVREGTWKVRDALHIQLTDAPDFPGDIYHVTASAARVSCS